MRPSNSVRFSCTALAGTGKLGVLKPDADGYYEMPIGGLNVYNSAGDYYCMQGARELFQESGALMRRIGNACLKGEYGHPKQVPGQSNEAYANRVITIEEKSTCVHFSDIWLDFDRVKDESGKPIVAIMAKLIPTGPYGPALKTSLENRKEDVCFSIRAFTEDVKVGGIRQRILREVVTFDHVVEPGIATARKYKAPTLESFNNRATCIEMNDGVTFTREEMIKAVHVEHPGIAMESGLFTGAQLFKAMGWTDNLNEIPSYLRW